MSTAIPIALLCTSRSWGGLEMNVARLSQSLREKGYVTLVVGLPGSPLAAWVQEQGGRFVPLVRRLKYFDLPAAYKLSGILNGAGCRLLLITTTRDMHTAALTKQIFAKQLRLVYWQQMQLGVVKKGPVHNSIHRALDAWIAPQPWLKDQVGTHTHMPLQKVQVIPLGVDAPALAQALPEGKLRARQLLSLQTEGRFVGILGRLDPGKGQHILLEAFAQLQHQFKDLCLLIQGDENKEGSHAGFAQVLKNRVSELGLTERVFFRAARADVATAYRAIDVFAMCSSGETYGMVTVEAFACGTPVVAARGGSNPDLLEGGKRGLLFQPDSPADLARAIREVLLHPADAANRAELARDAAFGPLSKALMLEKMDALFRSLLA